MPDVHMLFLGVQHEDGSASQRIWNVEVDLADWLGEKLGEPAYVQHLPAHFLTAITPFAEREVVHIEPGRGETPCR